MPGDDASVLTPGRMKKEAGLHPHNKDLITSSTLSPGSNPGHGESINTHSQCVSVCLCVCVLIIGRGQQISKYRGVNLMGKRDASAIGINILHSILLIYTYLQKNLSTQADEPNLCLVKGHVSVSQYQRTAELAHYWSHVGAHAWIHTALRCGRSYLILSFSYCMPFY